MFENWKNILEQAPILSDGLHIVESDLVLRSSQGKIVRETESGGSPATSSSMKQNTNLGMVENNAILAALSNNNGNRSRAAKELGITERTLYNKPSHTRRERLSFQDKSCTNSLCLKRFDYNRRAHVRSRKFIFV